MGERPHLHVHVQQNKHLRRVRYVERPHLHVPQS